MDADMRVSSCKRSGGGDISALSFYGERLQEPTGQVSQVFLSHSSEQKSGFVTFLWESFKAAYPAVHIFMDEYGLDLAGKALQNVHAALQDSFVVVLILSQQFIRKRYPMEELHLLLERDRQPSGTRARVLPVFYDITPGDVKEAYKEYGAAAGDALKQQWAADLEVLACITGIRPDQVARSAGPPFMRKVVDETARLLADMGELRLQKPQGLPDFLVPRDALMHDVVQLLAEEGSPRMVLLHGMAGRGKTTLAKVVFNTLHGSNPTVPCCFLDLENKEHGCAPEYWATKRQALVDSLRLGGAMGYGQQKPERGSLWARKVLLVVDNLKRDQLDYLLRGDGARGAINLLELLAEGSMVLMTSRDRRVLGRFGASASAAVAVEVVRMSEAESRGLFCWHAFGASGTRGAEEEGAVRAVLPWCGGLPQALEDAGKYVRRKGLAHALDVIMADATGMLAVFENCAENQERSLLGALRNSWQELAGVKQAILMDLASFFRGQDWELVSCYCEYGRLGELEDVGLVERHAQHAGHVLQLHAATADFCHLQAAGSRQTLEPADVDEFASMVDKPEGVWLRPGHHDADGGDVASQLRVLSAQKSLRVVHLERLVSVSFQHLTVLSPCLRWLGVQGVQGGASVPEELTLQLSTMAAARSSTMVVLQHLGPLTRLDLRSGKRVRVLWVTDCGGLRTLQLASGGLAALQVLRVRSCCMLEQVAGLCTLRALTRLELCGCSTDAVAAGLADAATTPSLVVEPCGACSIKALPDLAGLRSIRSLALHRYVELRSAPGLEALPSLTFLDVVSCTSLPELRLGSALRQLRAEGCHALATIGVPSDPSAEPQGACLEGLRALDCPLLAGLPDLPLLSSLTALQLQRCGALRELQLGSSLEELELGGCTLLTAIQGPPAAPSSMLRRVAIQNCSSLAGLPNMRALGSLACMQLQQCPALAGELRVGSSLERLEVEGCHALRAIQAAAFTGSDPQVSRLQQLRVRDCAALGAVEGLQLLGSLTQLEVQGCGGLRLLRLGTSLERLEVRDSVSLAEIQGLAAGAPGTPPQGQHQPHHEHQHRPRHDHQHQPRHDHHHQQPRQQQQQQQQALPPQLNPLTQGMQLRRLKVTGCPRLELPCLHHLANLQQLVYLAPGGKKVEWQRHGGGAAACPRPSRAFSGACGTLLGSCVGPQAMDIDGSTAESADRG